MQRRLAIGFALGLATFAWVAGWLPIAEAAQPTKRPTDEERGEELYRRHCVSCHGVRNGGQGPATTALVHPVPALQGKVTTQKDHIHVVLKGKGAMPGFEASFDRQDAVRVLKYMRSLGPTKALPDRAAKPDPKKRTPTRKRTLPKKPARPLEGPEREAEDDAEDDVEDDAQGARENEL